MISLSITGVCNACQFIEKTDEKYQEHLLEEADAWEEWMLETEKAKESETCILM